MGNRTLTAGVLKTTEDLQSVINLGDGFRFLKTLRGSPPYFEKAKKDLFADSTIRSSFTILQFFFCRNKGESLIENSG